MIDWLSNVPSLVWYYFFICAVSSAPKPEELKNPFAKWAMRLLQVLAGNLDRFNPKFKIDATSLGLEKETLKRRADDSEKPAASA